MSFTLDFNSMFNVSIDQVDGNTTTSVSGRTYVKDNFGYSAVGVLVNGLQDLPAVAIIANCSHDKATSSALWSSTFPGVGLPTVNVTNGSGSFIGSFASTPAQAIITSAMPFSLTASRVAFYGVVNSSGSGGVFTVGATGDTTVCTWSALPQLVHVTILNWTAVVSSAESADTVPAPVSRAVSSVVQGMAQAIQFGAHLDWDFTLWDPAAPNGANAGAKDTEQMLQALIADGVKAALTGYVRYCGTRLSTKPELMGVAACTSKNRTLSLHWRFGNEHYLGILAIIHTLGLCLIALFVACVVFKQLRVRDFDPFRGVDAATLVMDKHLREIDPSRQRVLIRNGRI
ncbi:hypothetical protein C8R44DRAFT_978101 [Mycena epipterygia]|nr:hypothetical protein C8R44DRAFT_978101 [Mycena epipterygia]